VAVCTCNLAVFLSKCARSGKLLLTDRASRDVPYLLQCLNRCAIPPAVPQQMCRTSCSASIDVPYLLQCLKSCAVPPAVSQEMCRTSYSASTDVPYLLQCLNRCAVLPSAVRNTSLRSVPTSRTVGAFRVCCCFSTLSACADHRRCVLPHVAYNAL
jgi:hypothetical protein